MRAFVVKHQRYVGRNLSISSSITRAVRADDNEEAILEFWNMLGVVPWSLGDEWLAVDGSAVSERKWQVVFASYNLASF